MQKFYFAMPRCLLNETTSEIEFVISKFQEHLDNTGGFKSVKFFTPFGEYSSIGKPKNIIIMVFDDDEDPDCHTRHRPNYVQCVSLFDGFVHGWYKHVESTNNDHG